MNDSIRLESRLNQIKNQSFWNGLLTLGAIFFLLYFPPTSFDSENFRINVNLDWVIAFVVMIIGIVRVFTLYSRRKEIELELSMQKGKNSQIFWTCENCGREFSSREKCLSHEKNCEKRQSNFYVCNICSERFDTKRELAEHEKNCGWTCDKCGKLFRNKIKAKEHEKSCKKR